MEHAVVGIGGPRSIYDKIWDSHIVADAGEAGALLYVDLHLIHEMTSATAFEMLRAAGRGFRRPALSLAVTDHLVPTDMRRSEGLGVMHRSVAGLLDNAAEFGVEAWGPDHHNQGILHVVGPELGLTLPGMVVACADSHTSTHGALGAIGIGLGTTEIGHVAAAQVTLQRRQRGLRVWLNEHLQNGVVAKDVALWLLAHYGDFGRGHAIEFAGPGVEALSVEGRMTLCNMAVEMGSRVSIVAPDAKTIEYLRGRPFVPAAAEWWSAVGDWQALSTDDETSFDREIRLGVADVVPMVTFGTNPKHAVPIDGCVPTTALVAGQPDIAAALEYMGLVPGQRITDIEVRTVFIGSCTNARIEDLRQAAGVLAGRHVAPTVSLTIVPGSQAVRREAEAQGLDQVFVSAGALWDEPGCGMCFALESRLPPGAYVASTSNRNFPGRQGQGVRTLLMSPSAAAATSLSGSITDPRGIPSAIPTAGWPATGKKPMQ